MARVAIHNAGMPMDGGKKLGVVVGILTALGAAIAIPKGCHENKKAEEEAKLAEIRRKAEEAELKRRTPPQVGPPGRTTTGTATGTPTVDKPAPAAKKPAPPLKPASELFVKGAVWEGASGGVKMRMEVGSVRDGKMFGRLHWYGSTGNLAMTARMTGKVTDPDRIAFEWRNEDIEFGFGYSPTTYQGTVFADEGEVRGNWGALGGPTNGGNFMLRQVP